MMARCAESEEPMDESPDAGRDVLVAIYESLKNLHQTLYEQGFKIQALEFTLKSFPDTRPVYESALDQAKSAEAVQAMNTSTKAYDALIALVRGGPHHSA